MSKAGASVPGGDAGSVSSASQTESGQAVSSQQGAVSGEAASGEEISGGAVSSEAISGGASSDSESTGTGIAVDPRPAARPLAQDILLVGVGLVLGAVAAAAVLLLKRRKAAPEADKPQFAAEPPAAPETQAAARSVQPDGVRVGRLHHIGARKSQQDSLGTLEVPGGVLAVVADGMGGLADGDKVSQKIVLTMMADGAQLGAGKNEHCLYTMAGHANREVLNMLGAANCYKSGSTLIAVLAQNGLLQWLSVGDSRIYLYRAGALLQLNREHTYGYELLKDVVNGHATCAEAAHSPQRKGLTSFVGMGEVKHADASPRPMPVCPGDRVLLMSDGVFNTLSEQEIGGVLEQYSDVQEAAAELERQVLARKNPKQDNFTAVILDF